jgi:hypothetical protein
LDFLVLLGGFIALFSECFVGAGAAARRGARRGAGRGEERRGEERRRKAEILEEDRKKGGGGGGVGWEGVWCMCVDPCAFLSCFPRDEWRVSLLTPPHSSFVEIQK